ncbi:MAG: tRNA epoxyqueuosine(34) reductase QueG [Proteobacteria bacterium]|nr:tRNA epoxyqueuosine(34) reductase QueG [Pseudomonadota bacterium]
MKVAKSGLDGAALLVQLRGWAEAEGFSQIGVADVDLGSAEAGLLAWLSNGFHGAMDYMAAHGLKRARPAELVPGTVRVITARMDYLPRATPEGWQAIEWQRLARPADAAVSIYARGRDYHKVLRNRLQHVADKLAAAVGPFGHRVFTDSAPVLEVELASRSGIGWRGKHTLTLHREAGSMFFLGEIYVDLPLPVTAPAEAHCGSCTACLEVCPTQAIVAPYRLDARRCISYLTIEHDGAIPVELRAAIGNRIYGCDDCQLICPWNKYARRATLPDFDPRAPLGQATLLELWCWDEAEFLHRTEGSAIRRIGHARWRRNLAVAMGNALRAGVDEGLRAALVAAREGASELLREHIDWALGQG